MLSHCVHCVAHVYITQNVLLFADYDCMTKTISKLKYFHIELTQYSHLLYLTHTQTRIHTKQKSPMQFSHYCNLCIFTLKFIVARIYIMQSEIEIEKEEFTLHSLHTIRSSFSFDISKQYRDCECVCVSAENDA